MWQSTSPTPEIASHKQMLVRVNDGEDERGTWDYFFTAILEEQLGMNRDGVAVTGTYM